MANNYPPLVLAVRDRLLASPILASLVSSGSVGATAGQPWVFIEYADDGLPLDSGMDKASVSVYQRGKQWDRANNTVRFPTIGVDVIATGTPKSSDGEWLARAVAQTLIDWFDDPSREHQTGAWTQGVWVQSLRWDGSLSTVEMENLEGVYRAEFSLEFELV